MRRTKLILSVLFLMLIVGCTYAFATEENIQTVSLDVRYNQSQARSYLKSINQTRSQDQVFTDADGQTVQIQGQNALLYDYGLEEMAMQRAAEISMYASNKRPDQSSFLDNEGITGENYVRVGQSQDAFDAMLSSGENFSEQWMMRNLYGLDDAFNSDGTTYCGIGYANVNGMNCLVVLFSNTAINSEETAAIDDQISVSIRVLCDMLTNLAVSKASTETFYVGESIENVPLISTFSYASDSEESIEPLVQVSVLPVWTDPTGTVSFDNQYITGNKPGSITLSANVFGKEILKSIQVLALPLENAVIQVSDQVLYQPEGSLPNVEISYNGQTLIEGQDYLVSYPGENLLGTQKIKITGIGNYSGEISQTYQVICTHTGGEATCSSGPVCDICHNVYGDADPEAHLIGTEDYQAPGCIEEGYSGNQICLICHKLLENGEAVPATGHQWEDHFEIIEEASCTQDGRMQRICSVCGEIKDSVVLSATGHIGGNASCQSSSVCAVCGESYGELNPSNHLNLTSFYSEDGKLGYYCLDCKTCLYEIGSNVLDEEHDYSWITVKEADSHENGLEIEKCVSCDSVRDARLIEAVQTETLAPTCQTAVNGNHRNLAVRYASGADCQHEGQSGEIYCLDCQKVLSGSDTIGKTAHQFVDGICMVCNMIEAESYVPAAKAEAVQTAMNGDDMLTTNSSFESGASQSISEGASSTSEVQSSSKTGEIASLKNQATSLLHSQIFWSSTMGLTAVFLISICLVHHFRKIRR